MQITDSNYPLLRALMARVIEQRGPDRPIDFELPDYFEEAGYFRRWEDDLAAMSPQEFDDLLALDRKLVAPTDPADTSAHGFANAFFTVGIDVAK